MSANSLVKTTVYVTDGWMLDHTSAVAGGARFGCSWDVGQSGDRVLLETYLDPEYARIIGAFDPGGVRGDYDRAFWDLKHLLEPNLAFRPYGDCCGLIYGRQGVCHTMANRLLLAGPGKETVNFKLKSFSGAASWLLYGYYGRRAVMPYLLTEITRFAYLAVCEKVFRLLRAGAGEAPEAEDFVRSLTEDRLANYTDAYVREFLREMNNMPSGAACDDFYRDVMRYELMYPDDPDAALARADIFFRNRPGGAVLSGAEANSLLDAFYQVERAMKKLESDRAVGESQPTCGKSTGAVAFPVDSSLREFNVFCRETLGARYKEFFGGEYNPDEFVLKSK